MCTQEAICVPVFNNFFETPCMTVNLNVRFPSSVLSTGGGGEGGTGEAPPKVFPEKKINSYFK